MRAFSLLLASLLSLGIAHAQDWAKERLEKSPRHGEFVELDSEGRKIPAFVVYPEISEKAPVVVVIHEIFGLTDWARSVCDELAETGCIAIAPNYLGQNAPTDADDTRNAVSQLSRESVMSDTRAAVAYARTLPAGNGKVAVAGFCWGGTQAFAAAEAIPGLAAAFVFYGTGPSSGQEVAGISSPVYGFYAANDARVTATIPETGRVMKAAGKAYEPVVYPDAGHGFMRAGEAPDASEGNREARDAAWGRWEELLGRL